LIVSLRDPVDRAYSGYLMAVRERYLESFPRGRLKFVRAETLNAQPAKVLKDQGLRLQDSSQRAALRQAGVVFPQAPNTRCS